MEGVTNLTGEGAELFKKKDKEVQEMIKNKTLPNLLLSFQKEMFLMGCCFSSNNCGLMMDHVYSVLKITEIKYNGNF